MPTHATHQKDHALPPKHLFFSSRHEMFALESQLLCPHVSVPPFYLRSHCPSCIFPPDNPKPEILHRQLLSTLLGRPRS